MKQLYLLAFLFLTSCSTPQDTTVNGGATLSWVPAKTGAWFSYMVSRSDSSRSVDSAQYSDTIRIDASALEGNRNQERINQFIDLEGKYAYEFDLEPNGDYSIGDSISQRRFPTGGGPSEVRMVSKDSVLRPGDTLTTIRVIRYAGREYLPSINPTQTYPHLLDSSYQVLRGFNAGTTIYAYNLWVDPSLGGALVKYVEGYTSFDPASRAVMTVSLQLTGHSH